MRCLDLDTCYNRLIMNYIKRIRVICFAIVLFFLACKKELSPKINNKSNSLSEIFDSFWLQMKINYVYWSIDDPQYWKDIYSIYHPKFDRLNIQDENDLIMAYWYFKEMCRPLSDGHFNITFLNPILRESVISPVMDRKSNEDKAIDERQIFEHNQKYFDNNSYKFSQSTCSYFKIITASINKNTKYIHFNRFEIQEQIQNSAEIRTVLNEFFLEIQNGTIQNLIIDLRNNDGGIVRDLNFFIGKLIHKKLNFGYIKYKASEDETDYFPPVLASVYPEQNTPPYLNKIYVLINNNTRSTAELTSIALKNRPNTLIIGEKSCGCTGILTPFYSPELLNGGPFKVGNFMNVNASGGIFLGLNQENYENKGLNPDIIVPFITSNKDIDNQLEYIINTFL